MRLLKKTCLGIFIIGISLMFLGCELWVNPNHYLKEEDFLVYNGTELLEEANKILVEEGLVFFSEIEDQMPNQNILTSMGIGIGSTTEEIAEKYANKKCEVYSGTFYTAYRRCKDFHLFLKKDYFDFIEYYFIRFDMVFVNEELVGMKKNIIILIILILVMKRRKTF